MIDTYVKLNTYSVGYYQQVSRVVITNTISVEFNTLKMRYPLLHVTILNLPVICKCGTAHSFDHNQSCSTGGFLNLRHNHIANLLAKHCISANLHGVETEPTLTPLSGEILNAGANTDYGARSDVKVIGFYDDLKVALFDVKIIHANAPSYESKSISSILKTAENSKIREYGQRVNLIEGASFTPFVMTSNGVLGKQASMAIKVLATRISIRTKTPYAKVISLLRCDFSFALLRAAIICITGSRGSSSAHTTQSSENLGNSVKLPYDFVFHEAKFNSSSI